MSDEHASIVVAGGDADSARADAVRAAAYAGFLSRRDGAAVFSASEPRCSELLARLSRDGRVFRELDEGGGGRLFYIPAPETASRFAEGTADCWPSALIKKLAKSVRRTPGALFCFPSEFDGDGIEVFITDWSPCPAACAVAVHREHPAAKTAAEGFTGSFVRHPLTGDLLPVYVADWVKPSFGTGAVLVNPAHDRVDLDYARRIGLPIRFALAPADFDGEPEHWLSPPIIKTGSSVRTGPYDGRDIHEASAVYFEVLAGRGLARRHEDVRLPPAEIAREAPDGTITPSAELEIAAALSAARDAVRGAKPTLILSAVAARDSAAVLAPLVADLEIAPRVVVLGAVERTATLSDPAADAAIAVAARPDQPAVVRKDLLEQVRRFDEIDARIVEPTTSDDSIWRADGGQFATALATGDTAALFKALYALQKELVGSDSPSPTMLAKYHASRRLLFGTVGERAVAGT